jgi:hypothetical protein
VITSQQPQLAIDNDDNSLDFLSYCTTALELKVKAAAASPRLPDSFDEFNARAFIKDVYGRETQI